MGGTSKAPDTSVQQRQLQQQEEQLKKQEIATRSRAEEEAIGETRRFLARRRGQTGRASLISRAGTQQRGARPQESIQQIRERQQTFATGEARRREQEAFKASTVAGTSSEVGVSDLERRRREQRELKKAGGARGQLDLRARQAQAAQRRKQLGL